MVRVVLVVVGCVSTLVLPILGDHFPNTPKNFCVNKKKGTYCNPYNPTMTIECPSGKSKKLERGRFCMATGRIPSTDDESLGNGPYEPSRICASLLDVSSDGNLKTIKPITHCVGYNIANNEILECPSGKSTICGENQVCRQKTRDEAICVPIKHVKKNQDRSSKSKTREPDSCVFEDMDCDQDKECVCFCEDDLECSEHETEEDCETDHDEGYNSDDECETEEDHCYSHQGLDKKEYEKHKDVVPINIKDRKPNDASDSDKSPKEQIKAKPNPKSDDNSLFARLGIRARPVIAKSVEESLTVSAKTNNTTPDLVLLFKKLDSNGSSETNATSIETSNNKTN